MMRIRVARPLAKRILGFLLVFSLFLLPTPTPGQTGPKRSLITQSIDENNLTLLKGNTYPLARPEFDRGPAPLSLPMQRMLLVLKRSPEQEAALGMRLDQQQDKSSPNFHNWLTPEQFGQQFGPSDEDILAVTGWLQSHGFQVAKVAKGRTVIEFSGTAEQVQEAFRTTIHKYVVDGADHWANATDPQIPSALAPVVVGVNSLHDFRRNPMNHYAGVFRKSRATGEVNAIKAQFSFGPGCGILGGLCVALGPYDFAAIYNLSPLWTAAVDGTDQTIAIVGETDINLQDVTDFRTIFNLPPPKLNIIHDGPAPGIQGDEPEANIDIQWSGAVAKNATIDFVVSASTDSTPGVDLSAEYIIDNNLAPVMSESYGECELGLGTAGNSFYNLLWQQAAAQGITVFVSSGDQGSAVCDGGGPAAGFGLAVSGLSSTPNNVSVGGTDFNDLNNPSTYWNGNNDSNQASAKGYIPEMTWNDSCTNSEIFSFFSVTTAEQSCNNRNVQFDGFLDVVGGSGGKSNCTSSTNGNLATCSGGYPKPSWQSGSGVPPDSKRDVPDVSLFASDGFNGSFYIICEADLTPDNTCNLNSPYFDFAGFGGTSVSSPAFAGIMALINQKTGSRQGNANYVLYKLAAQPGASCPSTANPGPACVFYDVPAGSTIAMPCSKGSKDCTTSNAGDQFGVLSGYPATAGYDLATGLGTVNASNLVAAWSSFTSSLKGSAVTLGLTPSPVSITHGAVVNVNIGVAAKAPATGTPMGLVSLIASTGQGFAGFTLSTTGSVSTTTNLLPGGNQYTVTAHYPGDGTFGVSDSPPVTVTVNPEPSNTTLKVLTADQFGNPIPFTSGPYGGFVYLRADVAGQSGAGTPTGQINFSDTVGGTTSNVPGGPYGLNGGGNTATPQGIFNFVTGQHSVIANYGGDASFKASTSPMLAFTITPAVTSLTAGPGSPVVNIGTAATFIANFSSTSCGNLPTGSVTFFSGTTSLGNGPLILSQNSATCTISGSAVLDTPALPLGVSSITAKYNGDGNYAPSTAVAFTEDVVIPTTISLTSSNPTIQQGQSVTFTATIAPSQGGGPSITGSVRFSNPGASCNSQVSNGKAQCTTSTLPPGPAEIDAMYSGDSNYGLSNTSFIETVTPAPDFSIVANPQTIFVASPGQSGFTTLTFTAMNGFSGTFNFSPTSCTGLPSESSCSFSPASLTLNGTTTSGMTTLTISTTRPSNVAPRFVQPPTGILWPMIGIGVALAFFFLLSASALTRRWNAALGVLAFAALLTFAACGGGGGGGPHDPGTPIGVDPNVVVSISSGGGVSHNIQLTVNVQ